jgi:hypothetical protein
VPNGTVDCATVTLLALFFTAFKTGKKPTVSFIFNASM